MKYPAPGSPELARRVRDLLSPVAAGLDETWGLDHGTWTVLKHVFPEADIPVVQLSIDETQPTGFHYEIGKQLVALSPLPTNPQLLHYSEDVMDSLCPFYDILFS